MTPATFRTVRQGGTTVRLPVKPRRVGLRVTIAVVGLIQTGVICACMAWLAR